MGTLTIKVAAPGASLSNGGSSVPGHIWYHADNGAGGTASYGYGPRDPGVPVGPGKVIQNDNSTYQSVFYTQTIEITDAQYAAFKSFGENPAAFGFDADNYHFLTNSCVDFFWGAMGAAGMNPTGSEGEPLPISNIPRIKVTKELFDKAKETSSPLILDLDGDGVETLGTGSSIYFDHDGNGFAENTGWAGADDGILVWDRNGNGRIDDGSELFGNHTVLANGQKAANGFNALADLDSNHDGRIDASDAAFAQLRIWKDGDSDARLDEGEWLTLSQANVASLGTGYLNQTQVDVFGNEIRQAGSYVTGDGLVRDVKDVWFKVDASKSVHLDPVPVTDEIRALPNVAGSGNVASLQQAMASDASGTLKGLVQAFASETNLTARQALLDQIIFVWSGSSQYTSDSRGGFIDDGRKIYALEAFFGTPFVQSAGINVNTPNPGPNAAAKLMQAYDSLADAIGADLMVQTHYWPLVSGLQWTFDGVRFSYDVTDLAQTLKAAYTADPVGGRDWMLAFGLTLDQVSGAWGQVILDSLRKAGSPTGQEFDVLLANIGHTTGGAQDDEIYGDLQANVLMGFEGRDTLYGDAGNDVLNGGSGNDYLSGDAGSDTYQFSRGWGQDILNNFDSGTGKQDAIVFDATLAPSDIRATRAGDNLLLSLVGGTDSITVVNYFTKDGVNSYQVEQIRFNDGTLWTTQDIRTAVATATAGNDQLYGYTGADTLSGGAGNDKLYGMQGNDVLAGGTGNDVLEGGVGSDTYLFNLGDGKDVIQESTTAVGDVDVLRFGEGIDPADIEVSTQGGNLVLRHANGADQVTLSGWFRENGPRYQVERIEFADGTVWMGDQLSGALLHPVGTEGDDVLAAVNVSIGQVLEGKGGNDTLTGGSGHDRLEGGRGNDRLNGGQGGDRYVFNLGDGQDVIYDNSGYSVVNDVLSFGAGIAAADISVSRSGTNLVLSHANGMDRVTILDWFFETGSRFQLERIEFADGTVWTSAQVTAPFLQQSGGEGDDVINGLAADFKQVLLGNGGNDTLTGGSGADRLEGGRGNDRLNGGLGGDRYVFNLGDGQDVIFDNSGF
ncbi:MAG: hypothetical protein LBJ37_16145, partial [Paucimonas sp.]|nr:hypothetical protein [Paucimonas sp.]